MGKHLRSSLVALTLVLMLPATVQADVWWKGWDRARKSAWKNFKRPSVWVPLAGAAAFGVTNADKAVSDWARDNQPIYGSDDGAQKAADRIKDVAITTMFVSSIAPAPTEDTGRGKRAAVAAMSGVTTWTTTEVLKEVGGRKRPDGSDELSFPSLHTSDVANALMFTKRNMEAIPLSDPALIATDVVVFTVEGLQGWARVEQGRHYPSDVLFGMALGNFVASFFYDWFIEDPDSSNLAVSVTPADDGETMVLNLSLAF